MPDISIIICTRDRAESLRATLQHVVRAAGSSTHSCEIVVIDNGSRDDTRDVVMSAGGSAGVCYVLETSPGLSIARNRALSEVESTVLLFTDDDVEVPAAWVDRMTGPIFQGE